VSSESVANPEDLEGGSRWHRWEPHIHAPGTAINDQFKGADAWDKYLTALENAAPKIRALGVTDYYGTDLYERAVQAKKDGRLGDCDLIFPNIEMRLNIATVKGRWANDHLLVSPEDPGHVTEANRFMSGLTFEAHDDIFHCTRDDLIKLGRLHDGALTTDGARLECGAQQFKVSFPQLRELFGKSDWAKKNILIAVAGSETDGTSGIREGADATLRQEVEKFAHIIFASSVAQREFWLGKKGATLEQLWSRYDGPKPCLHGSDAHAACDVGLPAGDRFSWVKGAVSFDSLRQACIDPESRATVGAEPPFDASPSQVIAQVTLEGAPWALTPRITLNPGLVAIIGARGSGKTALADIIAAGCDAIDEGNESAILKSASFISRAREFLDGAKVHLRWAAGGNSTRELAPLFADDDASKHPRARYLSQKFVEDLCSSDNMADSLVAEIERVIFESHSMAERDGTADFAELLEIRTSRHRAARNREEMNIAALSEDIGEEHEKKALIADLTKQIEQKQLLIDNYTADRNKLVAKGGEERLARLGNLAEAAEKVRGYLRWFSNQEQTYLKLKDAVADLRRNQAPETLRRTKQLYSATGLEDEGWQEFLLDYKGDVDAAIAAGVKGAQDGAASWKGKAVEPLPPGVPHIAEDAELKDIPLSLLEAESARLEKLISEDRATALKFSALSKRITEETTALAKLKERLEDCQKADGRIGELNAQRQESYRRIFDAIQAQEDILRALYKPLMQRLAGSKGTLAKLSFAVSRHANVEAWAEEGENLIDLARTGPFRGTGTLLAKATAALKPAWETGDAAAVDAAMEKFREDNQAGLLGHCPVPRAEQANFRGWLKGFAFWLFGTQHISINYSIDYEGVEIRKLSPGTRGIVLLLLYLALDDRDDRPLIIDQPEENLDPKSIHDELVHLFTEAKGKRQVIMVTHNANLVVNTDADQVIVAKAGPHAAGKLPPITYLSGGLENAAIRQEVCNILEGGDIAFRERARRLRVRLKR
jgi:hypothetical protein